MTEQEQIKAMTEKMKRCFEKNGLLNFKWFAEALVQAGYGDISEYEAEREMLGSQIKVLKQRLNNKYVEIEQLKDDYVKLQEQFVDYQMASDKEIAAQVKQAKIDVLNFLKDGYEVDISTSNDCDMVVRVDDIDELIEELQNDTK